MNRQSGVSRADSDTFTLKEMLVRVEGKLDAFIEEHRQTHKTDRDIMDAHTKQITAWQSVIRATSGTIALLSAVLVILKATGHL